MTNEQADLWLYDGGFSTDEIRAGCKAALTVLAEAGYTTDEAHAAVQAEAEGLDFNERAREAWFDAEIAALDAATVGWARQPEGAYMGLA